MRPVSEVAPIVIEVVARNAGVPPTQVHWGTTYTELGLIGPSKVKTFMELEAIFTVVLLPYIEDFITVGQTIEYISLNAPPAPPVEQEQTQEITRA
jgi:hypothetical protein